ncbi:MAG TPA: NADH-quinone oxidoreductase subunit L [Trebonia sp.]|jgi:NADH-quinone oxidoreductase subunit L|nr:NADH-quinone oxidoreductase subunit L [Trebonia sp.]
MSTIAATGVFRASWLLLAFPVFGAAVLLIGGRRTDKWGHLLAVLMSLASFVYGAIAFFSMLGKTTRSEDLHMFSWVPVAGFQANIGILLDPLSISFVLLITGVGSLIHIYSIGYMAHDADRRRFFSYLNLFIAAMLLLVLSDNYLGLYAGWEGVGLASYLLIGFWQFKPAPPVAAKKAFIANRVGDFGLSVAIMLMFAEFGTFNFGPVFGAAHGNSGGTGVTTALGLLLLLGACGKSAQVPLQSWLLDAMEGPTPVSALIHAATMVTAGVYLIVRSNPIFNDSPTAQLAVTVVGAVTLLFGAVIGCAKDDIKKALAGSTMSQIGYMTLGAGLGPAGYVFAIAHLLAHGFFKAGLFLGAGSVMHGMDDEVSMRRYGALRKFLPWTFGTFGLGYLAIIGIPPFSGFFTKDGIIDAAWDKGGTSGYILAACAILGAGITAFYMTRVMLMTWFGAKRWEEGGEITGGHEPRTGQAESETRHSAPHPHESPWVMVIPMVLLAIGSVGAGAFLIIDSRFSDFLAPVVGSPPSSHGIWSTAGIIALVLAVAGVGIAWFMYGRIPVPSLAPRGTIFTRAARADLGGDAFNESVLMRPGQWLTRLSVFFDNRGIDGLVNTIAATIGGSSGRLRRVQTGYARSYALSMLIGAVLLVAGLLVVRL